MGLKRGEHPVQLGQIRVVGVRSEPLLNMLELAYGKAEAALEGFPAMSGAEFVSMFCMHMRCTPSTLVRRIHFEYVDA